MYYDEHEDNNHDYFIGCKIRWNPYLDVPINIVMLAVG